MTFFGITIFASSILTSYGGGSMQLDAESTLKDKDSIEKHDTNNILAPQASVPTIKIGQQEWMAKDINTISYSNGEHINEAKSEKKWKEYGENKLGCYRKLSNGTFVYNGFAIKDKRGIVPIGFAIPTYNQYNKLITFLGGGDSLSGKATKSLATYSIFIQELVERRFKNGNIDENNSGVELFEIKSNGNSGFKAKKGGGVYDHGAGIEGNCSFWWTSSYEGQDKIVVDIGNCSQDLGGGSYPYPPTFGFAIRAIKK